MFFLLYIFPSPFSLALVYSLPTFLSIFCIIPSLHFPLSFLSCFGLPSTYIPIYLWYSSFFTFSSTFSLPSSLDLVYFLPTFPIYLWSSSFFTFSPLLPLLIWSTFYLPSSLDLVYLLRTFLIYLWSSSFFIIPLSFLS